MKKIGILHGRERTFPEAFIARVNQLAPKGVTAEAAHVNKVAQGEPTDYAVLIDRISQDVPFYRAYLKNAALNGTAVINNPFWWSADEKFFNNCLATKLGVAVPRTVILPSKDLPSDCTGESFSNLAYPLDWEGIFKYIGWPAYFKPHSGGGWKNVYKVRNPDEFFAAYAETHQLVMLLQSEVTFDDYFRCYCIGGRDVKIMRYEPRHPHHLRYVVDRPAPPKALLERVERDTLTLNHALGYDFNTVEFAVHDGVPYAIDFCNPAPDADRKSVGDENFAWVVDAAVRLALRRAEEYQPGKNNLTWGTFVQNFAAGKGL
jgi:glutathione synthase/RimK-type ligase-like ATP-grasp enzyme